MRARAAVLVTAATLLAGGVTATAAGPPAPPPGPLQGVAVLSRDDAWAVGSQPNPADADEAMTLTEHWDGSAWHVVPSPLVPERAAGFASVAAISHDDVWAVGAAGRPFFRAKQSLIGHWDGRSWRLVAAAHPADDDVLHGVAATGPDDVWAVGQYRRAGTTHRNTSFAEHWDGDAWHLVDVPHPGTFDELVSVSAVARDDVWAVGRTNSFTRPGFATFVLHFDGTRWRVVPSANDGNDDNALADVSASGPRNVWAVGDVQAGEPFPGQTLAERLRRGSFRRVPTPSPVSAAGLSGVVSLAADDAWAVGSFWADAETERSLIEHWDGRAWTRVAGPDAHLSDVAASAADDVWAVGSAIEHWDGRRWSLVAGT